MSLRSQHGVDPGIGCRDNEHAKTLEPPALGKTSLLPPVEVTELLSSNARRADEAIGPDVHGAGVLLKREGVTRVGIYERKEAIGDDRDRERLVLMSDGDAYGERSRSVLRCLGHVRQ